jgi:hypothetical protein
MGGGLMQLVAYGAQDIYLTGNPQITFFKVVYRRHTNFSMETIEQTISGASSLSESATSTGTVTISRNGDLVSSIYVTSATAGITNGDQLISQVEIEIGGQKIDRHYQEWNDIWNELTTPAGNSYAFNLMTGCTGTSGDDGVGLVQIPLNFWFCRNPGLALPLIALQYHEVKLKFTWGQAADVRGLTDHKALTATTFDVPTCKVLCDYIYLDTDERRRFAQVSHEYLIEQVQRDTLTNAAGDHKLNFNHPVKELIWTTPSGNVYESAKLTLNGHDRFSKQEEEYFQLRQPYQYHTTVPKQNFPTVADSHAHHGWTNLMTGTSKQYTSTHTAMTFANSAVTTNRVMVFQTATAEHLAATTTAAATAAEAETAFTIGLSFLTTDLAFTPITGQKFRMHLYGVDAATADLVAGQAAIHGHITQVHVGALAGGNTNADNTHLTFSHIPVSSTVSAEIVNAADFTITDFSVQTHLHANTSHMHKKINVYSFALKPEEHQPSGTCNFSRIDTAKLNFTSAAGVSATKLPGGATTGNVYAVNYNVLRIMSGMGGLAYSN